ncbi:MAG: D-2-hydroxyacid dehydrogenase, partial [Planctomycetales bacterium]|nr:D-2-hydroxyacid dehydrogenase [Planctomycetales bacterium]NIM09422.1 D-2-hydroxyacid dehydrogenase [Planctomycetales bacterium]NIN08900.1 D-2-hydroxyacid dehydrogenase [Planctomycetales bacterium]NIN78015.1 D-2-hydroxyacid dehydrogenase [Planctomycetales bacterium]NIO35203.1 D-2-hydroxyacid dehydrogenase [Planctomycetales bacterium]
MNTARPRIVVLDGYTLNPGDLSWEPLEALGDCVIHDRSLAPQIVPRAANAPLVLTNKTPLTADTIDQLPHLQYVGVLATGYDIVDVSAAQRRSIVVSNVPAYGTRSVAQMVFAHLLNLTQHVGDHAAAVRGGRWSDADDWCFWQFPLVELEGLTMG